MIPIDALLLWHALVGFFSAIIFLTVEKA